jgi:hypothetical protein
MEREIETVVKSGRPRESASSDMPEMVILLDAEAMSSACKEDHKKNSKKS